MTNPGSSSRRRNDVTVSKVQKIIFNRMTGEPSVTFVTDCKKPFCRFTHATSVRA